MLLVADSNLSTAMIAGGGIGIGIIALLALDASGVDVLTDALLAATRKWHGKAREQFSAVSNLVSRVTAHPAWAMSPELLAQLTENCSQLKTLMDKCETTAASSDDRSHRNVLLKTTVGICLTQVKLWAYGQYAAGIMTAEDVHSLGFLLPGETSGYHGRTEATNVVAEGKVAIISADIVRIVIDQASGENAGQVMHGWPNGVSHALIIIMAADGKTEVFRLITTRLHNDIEMPEGSHGKQFILKVSFMKHLDDAPRFGSELTFSMPLTTEDLAAAIDRQHHEEFEAHVREVEMHRQEVERSQAELDEARKK